MWYIAESQTMQKSFCWMNFIKNPGDPSLNISEQVQKQNVIIVTTKSAGDSSVLRHLKAYKYFSQKVNINKINIYIIRVYIANYSPWAIAIRFENLRQTDTKNMHSSEHWKHLLASQECRWKCHQMVSCSL